MSRVELYWNRVYRMDALQGLKRLPDRSVDLVITDPPYNIASPNRPTFKDGKPISSMKVWGHWDSYHPYDYDLLIQSVISECYRVLKPGGALYMFTAREQNGYFIRQAMIRGFTYRNQLVMIKKNPLPSLSKSNYRSAFETCMYLTKGKPKVFNFKSQQECKNIYAYSNHCLTTKHPTEKPLPFIKLLVEVSSNLGDRVLDPFMGSGTTAMASKELGRDYLGFDLESDYIQMIRQRLKGGKKRSHSNLRKAA